jgi:hypothetical protein
MNISYLSEQEKEEDGGEREKGFFSKESQQQHCPTP